jgi:hypothetical protein
MQNFWCILVKDEAILRTHQKILVFHQHKNGNNIVNNLFSY